MVNGSRFGVALMGLGIHRRSFLEAAIYAARRVQFGNRIDSYPLVRETLVDMLVDLEAGMAATYECAAATRSAQDAESGRLVRRILIPLAKMRCTRLALGAASTGLEVLGGNGYMEDWPMARQLRDAQCHTIWEGTENILCIDVRRAMRAEHAHIALLGRVEQALETGSGHKVLGRALDTVAASLADTRLAISYLEGAPDDIALLQSRRFAELLADTVEGALLVEEAAKKTAPEFIREMLQGELGKILAHGLKNLYPLKKIEIRSSVVLGVIADEPMPPEGAPVETGPAAPEGDAPAAPEAPSAPA